MNSYLALKHLHMTLALLSGLGFAVRGYLRLMLRRPRASSWRRWVPHLIDTLLLLSGVLLWWRLSISPLAVGWFGTKLLLVVVYIALGITAFRNAGAPRGKWLYLAALLVFVAILTLALTKPW
ncbi:MAG: SirB2 family protein [Wenzhouxiangellaceae bacterium]